MSSILDKNIVSDDSAYTLLINQGDEVQDEAFAWYLEANGRPPARSDIWHGTWRGIKENARWKTLRNAFQNTWPKPVVVPPVAPIGTHLAVNGKVYTLDGKPWRYQGSTDFRMARALANGEDMTAVFTQRRSAGANALRIFDYTPVKDWGVDAWDSPSFEATEAAIRLCNMNGFFVELVLLTDDDVARIEPAKALVRFLSGKKLGLRIEIGNEPNTHKNINTHALIDVCSASGFMWSTGDYENSSYWRGTYGTFHPARTFDFVRRAHDAMEYWNGGGPNNPSEPPCRVPWDNDEPIRPDQCGYSEMNLRAHAGASALFCGGATFHSQSGKLSKLWTPLEEACAKAFFYGLSVFPLDTANGPYRRIVEPGNEAGGPTEHARTYVVSNCAVRCQQVGTAFPEPGWTSLDSDGVLWRLDASS